MDDAAFKRILTAFADSPADLDFSKGMLVLQVRDELIEAKVSRRAGALQVEEFGTSWPAEKWVIQRVARLPLLADRLLSHVSEVPNFVTASANFLDSLEFDPEEQDQPVADALSALTTHLGAQPAGTSSVMYLTSDAGEGKTSLIQQLSRAQARRYKEKVTDWLLVPVSLGGRTFLRFDDVVVGALVNRLRFPLLYFDAFIELVRMGAIVLALDGFEEMFVEGAAGDAVSALGSLMQTLNSEGTVLIAARTAYFDYKRLETQARLFDTLGSVSVSFSRMELNRWDRQRFLAYAALRARTDGEQIFEAVSRHLGTNHPLLCRAVLVRRLLDVATEASDLDHLLRHIQRDPDSYFGQFVEAILSREANEKWIDRSGEPAQPLLSMDEHEELLSWVANEMWLTQSGDLSVELLDISADLFCDDAGKPPNVRRQIVERLKQHALLARNRDGRATFSFDHDEFYYFFLGRAVGRTLRAGQASDVRHMLGRAVLPRIALDAAAAGVESEDVRSTVGLLCQVCQTESQGSLAKENAGAIAVRLLGRAPVGPIHLRSMVLPEGAFENRELRDIRFEQCYVYRSRVQAGALTGSAFEDCTIERLDLVGNDALKSVAFINSPVSVVTPPQAEHGVFDPELVVTWLGWAGAALPSVPPASVQPAIVSRDSDLILTERVVRKFLRATEINENSLRKHLGARMNHFMDNLVPDLLRVAVLEQVEYRGGGQQARFGLGIPLRLLNECFSRAGGRYDQFLRLAAEVSGKGAH